MMTRVWTSTRWYHPWDHDGWSVTDLKKTLAHGLWTALRKSMHVIDDWPSLRDTPFWLTWVGFGSSKDRFWRVSFPLIALAKAEGTFVKKRDCEGHGNFNWHIPHLYKIRSCICRLTCGQYDAGDVPPTPPTQHPSGIERQRPSLGCASGRLRPAFMWCHGMTVWCQIDMLHKVTQYTQKYDWNIGIWIPVQ